jgi:hypothetical protein
MVLLYSISKELAINALTFDLFWGYPSGVCDFLDGTCMLYTAGNQFYSTVDYSHRNHIPNLLHSGDVMDHFSKTGTI